MESNRDRVIMMANYQKVYGEVEQEQMIKQIMEPEGKNDESN